MTITNKQVAVVAESLYMNERGVVGKRGCNSGKKTWKQLSNSDLVPDKEIMQKYLRRAKQNMERMASESGFFASRKSKSANTRSSAKTVSPVPQQQPLKRNNSQITSTKDKYPKSVKKVAPLVVADNQGRDTAAVSSEVANAASVSTIATNQTNDSAKTGTVAAAEQDASKTMMAVAETASKNNDNAMTLDDTFATDTDKNVTMTDDVSSVEDVIAKSDEVVSASVLGTTETANAKSGDALALFQNEVETCVKSTNGMQIIGQSDKHLNVEVRDNGTNKPDLLVRIINPSAGVSILPRRMAFLKKLHDEGFTRRLSIIEIVVVSMKEHERLKRLQNGIQSQLANGGYA